MVKYHLAIILASLAIAGCSGFNEFRYRSSQKSRAREAWKVAGAPGAGADYKDGWQTGYFDLSMGSDGQVPPVPPKKYWSDKYQNPAGQMAIADWYSGYQDGVTAADQIGEFEWQLVPSSGVAGLPGPPMIEYPTYYGGPPTGDNELPLPLPAAHPVPSDFHQLPQARRQQSSETVAGASQPALDLRILNGRPPAAPDASVTASRGASPAPPAPSRVHERLPQPAQTPLARENQRPSAPRAPLNEPRPAISDEQYIASQPERAIPAPAAPGRVHERLPQPTQTPLATNARGNQRPSAPPTPLNEPRRPTISDEQHLASQPERWGPRSEELLARPPERIEHGQPRGSAVTSKGPPRQSPAVADNEQQLQNAKSRDAAPLPSTIHKELVVTERPMSNPTTSPAPSPAPNSPTKPARSVTAARQPASPAAEIQGKQLRSVLRLPPTSGQPLAGKSIVNETPKVSVKPVESKPRREQVVSQQPATAAPSRSATPPVSRVVTPNPPAVARYIDDRGDTTTQSERANPGTTIPEPTTEITSVLRKPELADRPIANGRWATARKPEPEDHVAARPRPQLDEFIKIPATRTPGTPAPETSQPEAAEVPSAPEPAGTIVANPDAATDTHVDVVNAPHRADEPATVLSAREPGPTVETVPPTPVTTNVVAIWKYGPIVTLPKTMSSELVDNNAPKSDPSEPVPKARPGDAENELELPASSRLGMTGPVVKLAKPIRRRDTRSKPIVVVARPTVTPAAPTMLR